MSSLARLSRFAVLVSGLAVLAAGCSGGTTETPPVATLQSAPAPGTASSAPSRDQRPVFPFGATEDERKAMTRPWADCMAEHGGPRYKNADEELIMKGGVPADDAKGKAALRTCLPQQPEAFEDHQRRTDLAAYRDNQREWYQCAEAAGYQLTAPDPDTGQFGLTAIGPQGDFESPAIQECMRKAFTD